MKTKPRERGQALIIIVFAILGLFGITALAVDGGMSYSDRRAAQNAADSAALAAALSNIRGNDITSTAMANAAVDGYDNNQRSNWVKVTSEASPTGSCTNTPAGTDITVDIKSVLRTYFGPVIGINQVNNTVTATARSCESYRGPLLNGNAIVALAKHGVGFNAKGNVDWKVTGGGIFSNSADAPSALCRGSTNIIAPSLTSAGSVDLNCHTQVPQITQGAPQWQYKDYADLLPPEPLCTGNAQKVGNFWVAQSGVEGSKVALSGDMQFGPGLFCITNSPGPYHGKITGDGVTFFIMPTNFTVDFNGGGGKGGFGGPLTAPTSGKYAGVLIFAGPQTTGTFGFYGNGNGLIQGSVIMPSMDVRMYGNSDSSGYNTQIVANTVFTGGNANININYNAKKGYQTQYPALVILLR